MNKLYLIVVGSELERGDIISFLEKNRLINFWFHNMPNSFFVRSYLSADKLSEKIQSTFGNKTWIITQILSRGNFSGYIPEEHVKFFENL